MRKCLMTTNVNVMRNDTELQKLWEDLLCEISAKNSMITIDPTIKSRERNDFFQANRSYFVRKEVIATFHQWGTDFIEFDSGPSNYTVAIVELEDGSIVSIKADKIKFIDEVDNDKI